MQTRFIAVLGILCIAASACRAQSPASPPPPEKYKATLRYNIQAPRDTHVARYDAMIEHLKKLDFTFEKGFGKIRTDREDPGKNQLSGILPSRNLFQVFNDPHIESMLVVPEELELPAEGGAMVRVRLELAGGLPVPRQLELVEQTRAILFDLGFREALGYDHRGHTGQPFTRLVGAIPAGQLLTLTRDLRNYPFGWFAPQISLDSVPMPLRVRHPILVTEVLPASELVRPYKEDKDAVPPVGLEKLGQELWKHHREAILTGEKDIAATADPIRVEIFLAGSSEPTRTTPSTLLTKAAHGLFVERQVGQTILATVDPSRLAALARVPEVILIRLPRSPIGPVDGGVMIPNHPAEILKSTGLAELHARGKRGKGVRIAVVDRDFRGWRAMVEAGKLPAKTRLVDITRQHNSEVESLPEAGDPDIMGHGTQAALAVAFASPDSQLVLVRIQGRSPLELVDIGQFLMGDPGTSTIAALHDFLTYTDKQLASDRLLLLAERKEILETFRDDTDDKRTYGFLGPAFGWLFSDRSWHYDRMKHQEQREQEQAERFQRFRTLIADIASLKGTHIAVCNLNWPDGYPLGGSGPVVRWFNDKFRGPVWIQAAGNTRGQAWSGTFRDEDGNGILEFADPSTPLKKGRWTHELAFLDWQSWSADVAKPESVPIRVTVQWRETHDPLFYLDPMAEKKEERDPFARPQARVDVLLVRQVDPEGKTVGADVFELVARNAAVPVRLECQPGTAVYETSFTAALDPKGQYALRVISPQSRFWSLVEVEEGRPIYLSLSRENLRTTRPAWAPTLPDLEPTWELQLRLFVETLGAASGLGRVVLSESFTDEGSMGTPAEARGLLSIGAVSSEGKKTPYSAEGPPALSSLGSGPALYAPAELQLVEKAQPRLFGTSVSASLTAGWLAAAFTEAFDRDRVLFWFRSARGKTIGVK